MLGRVFADCIATLLPVALLGFAVAVILDPVAVLI
jgi:hypothetical protein